MQSPREDREEERELFDVFNRFGGNQQAASGDDEPGSPSRASAVRLSEANTILALRALGQYLRTETKSEIFKEFPSNGASFADFVTLSKTVKEANEPFADVMEAFGAIDEEKTGYVTAEKLLDVLKTGAGLDDLTSEAVLERAKEIPVVEGEQPEGTLSFDAVTTAISEFLG